MLFVTFYVQNCNFCPHFPQQCEELLPLNTFILLEFEFFRSWIRDPFDPVDSEIPLSRLEPPAGGHSAVSFVCVTALGAQAPLAPFWAPVVFFCVPASFGCCY